jgi:hypothetical protein
MFVVEHSVARGRIYASLFTAGLVKNLAAANPLNERAGFIYLYSEGGIPDDAVLMIGSSEIGMKGRLFKVSVIPTSQLSRSEYKWLRAHGFDHWYYSCDFGDGVSRRATIPNEEAMMPGLLAARSRNEGGTCERSIGCANSRCRMLGRFQTMEFARRGAIVTGIDWDKKAIEQAKFVHECVADQFPHPVTFQCCNLFDCDAPDKSFDYVHCS